MLLLHFYTLWHYTHGEINSEKRVTMLIIRELLKGIVSVMTISPSPLYRYPYRNSAEAFKGDWARLGKDVVYIFEQGSKKDVDGTEE